MKTGKGKSPELSEQEITLFRESTRDVKPLRKSDKVTHAAKRPRPVPYQTQQDEQQVLVDLLSDHIPWQEGDEINESTFLRNGISRQILKKLRSRHWVVQSELDLHGLTSLEAKQQLVMFLAECKKHGHRHVRIIHGKGLRSKNREPVLRTKVRNWLMQRDEVLAFCEAREVDGGSGAVIVLLKI